MKIFANKRTIRLKIVINFSKLKIKLKFTDKLSS